MIRAGISTPMPSGGAHGSSLSRSSLSRSSNSATSRQAAPPRVVSELANVSRNLHGLQQDKQVVRVEKEKRKLVQRKLVQAGNASKKLEIEEKKLALEERKLALEERRVAIQQEEAKASREMMMMLLAKHNDR
jgi:hypothetical protein